MTSLWHMARNLIVTTLSAILLFPLVILLIYSITDPAGLQQIIPSIHDKYADHYLIRMQFHFLSYWQIATESQKFSVAFLNSLTYSLFTTFGQLLLAIPAAIALSVLKVQGRYLIIPVYLILMMMPFQVTMVPTYLTLYEFHMLDSPAAIIIPQWFVPFSVIMLYLFMIQIPHELHEAAEVDGAGTFRLVRHIVLPLTKHGIWSVGLLHFIDSWNLIEQPIVFLTSIDLMPLSMMIRQSLERSAIDLFVPAVLFMLPIMILYSMYHRSIMNGFLISFTGNRKHDG